jgi:hypothetical protein
MQLRCHPLDRRARSLLKALESKIERKRFNEELNRRLNRDPKMHGGVQIRKDIKANGFILPTLLYHGRLAETSIIKEGLESRER